MKKIIVFGATGHIGAYTIDYLKDNLDLNEYEIIAVGRRDVNFYQENGFQYYKVDIREEKDFLVLPFDDVYAVIHLAGVMPASMYGYNPYDYIKTNIEGTLNILEYCRKANCKKIISTHTESDLSGYWESGALIGADLPPKFDYSSNYALYIISRLNCVEMMKNYEAVFGIKHYVIRCSTIYCYTENPYMYKLGKRIIPGYIQIYEKAMKAEPIEIWGDPNVKTDIVYVKDFAQIVMKMIIRDAATGFYNVGTNLPVSLKEQVEIAVEVFGEEKKSLITVNSDKPNGRNFRMDIKKTCENLGYEPKFDYRSYLLDYKQEMRLNRFKGLFSNRDKN